MSNYIELSTMAAETKSSLADGEVLGRDADGALIQWDATTGAPYNSGQTVEEFGLGNLSEPELKRLNLGKLNGMKAIKELEDAYVEAAVDLRSKQSQLQNCANELDSFIALREELKLHPDFPGFLPKTYFSGGGLDPEGVDGNGSDGCDYPGPGM